MEKEKIVAIVTGGTFDKEYNLITGQLYFKETHLPEIFDRGRCTLDIEVETLMMVDSLHMTEAQRQEVIAACQQARYQRILITHGTDTMVTTAKAIAQAGNIEGKTVVIVGAMIPYKFGMSSDGFFNLGSALAFVQTLPPGVYIAMHGQYFLWDDVVKNRATGYFEQLNRPKHSGQ